MNAAGRTAETIAIATHQTVMTAAVASAATPLLAVPVAGWLAYGGLLVGVQLLYSPFYEAVERSRPR